MTDLQLYRWNLVANLYHPHLIRIMTMGRSSLSDEPLIYLLMEYANENLAEGFQLGHSRPRRRAKC